MLDIREGNGTPLQYSCLENPMDIGAWWAAVHGVAKSRTRLSDFTFTFHFHALEEGMATHSRVLAWRIPRMVEPDGLPSVGSHRVEHDWSDLVVVVVVCLTWKTFFECNCSAGFPGGSAVKIPLTILDTCRRLGFNPWVGKTPWRRKWQPTPVLAWEVSWTEEPDGL